MQFGVLATDFGKHTDETLAIHAATGIVQIGADASKEQAITGRKLENEIIECLESHFRKLADHEHAQIAEKGTAHLASSLDPHPEILSSVLDEIMAIVAKSNKASWFNPDSVRQTLYWKVGQVIKDAQHMHRDWFARFGKVGHGSDLAVPADHDHLKHTLDENVQRWKDLHEGEPEDYRNAVHEHATNLKQSAA